MAVTVTCAFNMSEAGLGEHVPAGIDPTQETVTGPLKPPTGASDNGNVADCPAEIVAEVELPDGIDMMMSVPSPDRVTACGLAGALSEIVIAPARAPVTVGLKVTEMVQEEFAATLPAHVSVSAKSPLALMLVTLNPAFPVFVSVTICAELAVPRSSLPNAKALAERLTAGPAGVPVPLRTTD